MWVSSFQCGCPGCINCFCVFFYKHTRKLNSDHSGRLIALSAQTQNTCSSARTPSWICWLVIVGRATLHNIINILVHTMKNSRECREPALPKKCLTHVHLCVFQRCFLFVLTCGLHMFACLELNLSSKKFSWASCDTVDLKLCLAKFSGPSPRGTRARGFSLGKKPMNLALTEI